VRPWSWRLSLKAVLKCSSASARSHLGLISVSSSEGLGLGLELWRPWSQSRSGALKALVLVSVSAWIVNASVSASVSVFKVSVSTKKASCTSLFKWWQVLLLSGVNSPHALCCDEIHQIWKYRQKFCRSQIWPDLPEVSGCWTSWILGWKSCTLVLTSHCCCAFCRASVLASVVVCSPDLSLPTISDPVDTHRHTHSYIHTQIYTHAHATQGESKNIHPSEFFKYFCLCKVSFQNAYLLWKYLKNSRQGTFWVVLAHRQQFQNVTSGDLAWPAVIPETYAS